MRNREVAEVGAKEKVGCRDYLAEQLKLFGSKGLSAIEVELGELRIDTVLDADPMSSVQKLHKIYAVVRGGRFYSQQDLDGLKDRVQKHMESAKAAAMLAEKATP